MMLVQNLTKRDGHFTILNNIHFEVQKGDVIGLVGPSGSGKSTMLRLLHGLIKKDAGTISYHGKTGIIFQQFHLFAHLNVLENITYAPLKVLKKTQEEVMTQAEIYLKRMALWEKRNYFPHKLSGGQKQRVAIIRSLMMAPDILLFDEPTSALDPHLTQEVANIILELKEQGYTLIIASHEMSFLKQVASRILTLKAGELLADKEAACFFAD